MPLSSEGRDEEACRGFSNGSSSRWTFRDADPRVSPAKREPHHTRLFVLPQPQTCNRHGRPFACSSLRVPNTQSLSGALSLTERTQMTLILTIANRRGTFQSSDFQLTAQGTGKPVSDEAGSKQLEATLKGLNVQLAFTGIAKVSNRRTIDWLLGELKALSPDTDLQVICEALARRSAAEMKPLGPNGMLTVVLAAAAVGHPFRIAVVSNTQWSEPPVAKGGFDVQVHTITKPFGLISGYRKSVSLKGKMRLKALARAVNKTPKQILDALAGINAFAAENSGGYISKGCWVASQYSGGDLRRTELRSIGDKEGSVGHLFSGLDLLEWVGKNFRAAPGEAICIHPLGGVMAGPGGGVPLPPAEGEPRDFTLSVSSFTGILWEPNGQHCASLQITKLEMAISAKRNRQVTTRFAGVELSKVSDRDDFPQPLFPWPIIESGSRR